MTRRPSRDRPLTDSQERALVALADEIDFGNRLVVRGAWLVYISDVRARYFADHGLPTQLPTFLVLQNLGLVSLEPGGRIALTEAGSEMLRSMGD